MSFHVSLDSMESIHSELMHTLLNDPDCESAPRGKPIKELIAASFTLTDPRNRLIMSPARAVNYGFAVGELCWYARADTDLETMLYYNRRMALFSDDGETINSAYGYRIFDWDYDQFTDVIAELRRDPDSRRAVMHINHPTDLKRAVGVGSKDVPCTMSLQLLIRDRKLHMHVLMRSNDVVWGLPYDVFSFTCLQEAFLYILQREGVPVDDLGSYHHSAGSLHLYETHFGMADLVSKELAPYVAPMKPFTLGEFENLAEKFEPSLRKENAFQGIPAVPEPNDDSAIEWMMVELWKHKIKRLTETANKENDVKPT